MYYFDHTATKLINQDILDFYKKQLKENNYNPAAIYTAGIKASESIQAASKKIAEDLNCSIDEIIYTSGATESINTAIKGIAFSPNPKHKRILTSAGEHAATLETLKFLEQKCDYIIDICDLNENGQVDIEQFENYLQKNKYDLITLIHVNNVLGTINPIKEIVKLRDQYQGDLPIHLDSVQALGKILLDLHALKVELISFSLHKIGVPKGIGLLYKAKNTRIEPLIHGGGQQNNLRSGTENPALAVTAAYAINQVTINLPADLDKVRKLKEYLQQSLSKANFNYHFIIDSKQAEVVPHINAILFPDLRAETLLNVLNAENIAVSIGSACSNKKSEQNLVLRNLQLAAKMDKHILRISLSSSNSEQEIDVLVTKIAKALAKYAI